jgi:hypothetical protein
MSRELNNTYEKHKEIDDRIQTISTHNDTGFAYHEEDNLSYLEEDSI